jgi:hypothetical protein
VIIWAIPRQIDAVIVGLGGGGGLVFITGISSAKVVTKDYPLKASFEELGKVTSR